jgi:tight adherence protein C
MSELALMAGFFLFVILAVSAAGYLLVLKPSQQAPATESIPATPITWADPEAPALQSFFIETFRAIGEALPGAKDQANPIRKSLVAAGYRWPSALPIFYGLKCAGALLLAVIASWAAAETGAATSQAIVGLLCAAAFGFLIPDRILDRLAKSRAQRLRRALPAALDLMTLAVEAGQSMDQAMINTSRAIRLTHPDLSQELSILHLELRASSSRADSIRQFGERNQEPELKKLASLILDTDRFGSSLGPALRTHARYLRIRFRQHAQEKARKVGVKLIFPVFFLIFPSVILVTLGPAVILISTQLKTLTGK